MAKTVADILGESKFDVDAPGGSVSSGRENSNGRDDERDGGSKNDAIVTGGGTSGGENSRNTANPADARADDDGNDSRSNARRTRNRNARTDNADANTRTRKESAADLDLAEFLLVAHDLLARVTGPEFQISPLEAKVLGGALKRVLKHLPKFAKMTPLQEAVSGLLAIVVIMYVPRYMKFSAKQGTVVDAPPTRKETTTPPPQYTAAVGNA